MYRSRYVGIDPGKTGGFAILDQQGVLRCVCDLPANPRAMIDLFVERAQPIGLGKSDEVWQSAIELPVQVPKQSTAAAQTLGICVGWAQMMMCALEINMEVVDPRVWKRRVFYGEPEAKGPLDKKASRSLAERLAHPYGNFGQRRDEGRAEAYLIAYYVYLKFNERISRH